MNPKCLKLIRQSQAGAYAVSVLATILTWATQSSDRAYAGPIRQGLDKQIVTLRDNAIEVLTYRPAGCTVRSLLLAFHGSERNAEAARSNTRHFADSNCLIVLAPFFAAEQFQLWRYNQGGVVDHGIVQPPDSWTDTWR